MSYSHIYVTYMWLLDVYVTHKCVTSGHICDSCHIYIWQETLKSNLDIWKKRPAKNTHWPSTNFLGRPWLNRCRLYKSLTLVGYICEMRPIKEATYMCWKTYQWVLLTIYAPLDRPSRYRCKLYKSLTCGLYMWNETCKSGHIYVGKDLSMRSTDNLRVLRQTFTKQMQISQIAHSFGRYMWNETYKRGYTYVEKDLSQRSTDLPRTISPSWYRHKSLSFVCCIRGKRPTKEAIDI